MSERAPEGKKTSKKNAGVTRRSLFQRVAGGFVAGLDMSIAGGMAGAVALEANKAAERRAYLATRDGGFKNSLLFRERVEKLMEQYPHTHMSGIRKNAQIATIEGNGESQIGTIRKWFMSPDMVPALPAIVREELWFLGIGIAANESSYDNASDSGEAQYIFQFTNDTLTTLNLERDTMESLKNQVRAANMLFNLRYREVLARAAVDFIEIEERYFKNEPERFQRQFMVPVLLSAFHGGPKRISDAVTWFAQQPSVSAQGYDVYEAMAQGLHEENAKEGEDPVAGFGKYSAAYVGKVYAFSFLLQKDLDNGRLTTSAPHKN